MTKFLSVTLSCLLVMPIFSFNVLSAEEEDVRFPYTSTVTYGTAAGTVANMAGIDSSYYEVAEEDTNSGNSYTNTTLDPNANGTYTQWGLSNCADSAWGHHRCVDEGPPHDENISYVRHVNPGGAGDVKYDTYGIEDYGPPSGSSIGEIRVSGVALVDTTFATSFSNAIYSGTTLAFGSGNALTLPYTNYTTTWATNPDDSAPWEEADIDALEIGFRLAWDPIDPPSISDATLGFVTVQSSTPLDDYTLDFRLDFQGIEYSDEPKLVVTGYRGGDAETITLQILRGGVWTTLSANAFGAASATVQYDLSKLDVAGGSAAVRIVDNDATDDDQSTVYIDEMKITTTGESADPAAPIDVYVHLSYDLWGNKIIVTVDWIQTGGREPGVETGKWAILTADGVEMGSYQVEDRLVLEPPWSWADGNDHIVNATGVVNVVFPDWGHNQTYYSDPDTMRVSNFPRWAVVILLLFVLLAIIAIIAVSAVKEAKELKQREEEY